MSCSSDKKEITQTKMDVYFNDTTLHNYSPAPGIVKVEFSHDAFFWSHLVQLIQNGKILKPKFIVDNDTTTDFCLLFDSLKEGIYSAHFISIFRDTIKQSFILQKNQELLFPKQCSNYYKEWKEKSLLVNSFRVGDTLRLYYNSIGCFHSETIYLEIFYSYKRLIAQISEGESPMKYLNGNKILGALVKLEESGNQEGVCTNTDTYVIELNKHIVTLVHTNCSGSLYEKLGLTETPN